MLMLQKAARNQSYYEQKQNKKNEIKKDIEAHYPQLQNYIVTCCHQNRFQQ